jgi:hypothetical protein
VSFCSKDTASRSIRKEKGLARVRRALQLPNSTVATLHSTARDGACEEANKLLAFYSKSVVSAGSMSWQFLGRRDADMATTLRGKRARRSSHHAHMGPAGCGTANANPYQASHGRRSCQVRALRGQRGPRAGLRGDRRRSWRWSGRGLAVVPSQGCVEHEGTGEVTREVLER